MSGPPVGGSALLPGRLQRQQLTRPALPTPADLVAWFGAMQAQDYLGALWAVGLRTPGAGEPTLEAALADGSILRTHIFRWTWQFVAAADLRWMLALVSDRLIRAAAGRYRQLELDARTISRALTVLAQALEGGHLTRTELGTALTRARIVHGGGRLPHLLGHAELAGLICSGARRGKHLTYALLDQRAPGTPRLEGETALAELARRYYQSRGQASERDFAWWTGLPLSQVRLATSLVREELETRQVDGVNYYARPAPGRSRHGEAVHLLPPFDEYLIAYQDRTAMVDPRHWRKVNGGGGLLNPVVVIQGLVRGTWKRELTRDRVRVTVTPFDRFAREERSAIMAAAERYGRFLGREVEVSGER